MDENETLALNTAQRLVWFEYYLGELDALINGMSIFGLGKFIAVRYGYFGRSAV